MLCYMSLVGASHFFSTAIATRMISKFFPRLVPQTSDLVGFSENPAYATDYLFAMRV